MGEATIPQLVPRTVLRFAEARGLDIAALIRGLAIADAERRVTWDDLSHLFERLEERDPRSIPAFAEYYVHRVPLVSFLASYVVSAEGVYRLAFTGWRRVWPMLRLQASRTPTGWTLTSKLADGHRACPPFYRLLTEIMKRLPRIIGRPDRDVVARLAERSGEWRVALARDERVRRDVELEPEAVFATLRDDLFAAARPQVPPSWGLTPAEERAAMTLADGKTVAQAAAVLGVSRETVRTLLKRAMAKADVHRQAELVARLLGGGA
jgi:DNA-binding CsgD family transcriptional regulator